jgi:hypothetical protein
VTPARRRAGDWDILLTLSPGFFMTLLDLTIVNIAIPDMRSRPDRLRPGGARWPSG